MCDGIYEKDPMLAESHRKIRYVRRKATYYLRGRYRRIGGKNCVYCGFKAQTGDHVPALFLGYINGVVKGVIVSSCYDCNKHLGASPSTCLKERVALLVLVYEEEARKNGQSALKLKAARCKQRMTAVNCSMLKGSAALFSENGEAGGEELTNVM